MTKIFTIIFLPMFILFVHPANAQKAPVAGSSVLSVDVNVNEVFATGYRASKLLGTDIYNDKYDKIGKVDDLIVAGDGKVTFAVISVGQFLGLGGKNVAVPTGLFKPGEGGKIILAGGTKGELKKLPEFKYAK